MTGPHPDPKSEPNPFRRRIDRGEVPSLEDLKGLYKAEVKRLHPDLHGGRGPAVDFDRLRRDFDEACRYWNEVRGRQAAEDGPAQDSGAGAFLDEFRNLVARGFPVNVQAAGRNKAYAESVRRVSGALEGRFGEGFFPRVNAEARLVKRRDPGTFWFVLQVCWGAGDWRLTGFDFYRRTVARHRNRIGPGLAAEGYPNLARFLEFLEECLGT